MSEKVYANVFVVFSEKPFPVDSDIDLVKAAKELGLEPIADQEAEFKLAALRLGWKEDLSDDPRFAPTAIPEGTSPSDQAQIEAANASKAEALEIAQNPQWFVEDALAVTVLALIHDEKALDVTPRNTPAFQQEFAAKYETA